MPGSLEDAIDRGYRLHESGKLKEAEAAYREALDAFGPDPLLLYDLGVLLEDLGRKAEAADAYRAALQGDPGMADCHYNLALLCEQLRRPQEAIRHMAQYRRLVVEK
jgi:tetratricopeptide (TPR) repeat protein